MHRHPQKSTHFPYTTLFRSLIEKAHGVAILTMNRPEQLNAMNHQLMTELHDGVMRACADDEVDRKSTRLNSSHTVISYAVFCLKKKNTKMLITVDVRIIILS